MTRTITKRDGRKVEFDTAKIARAVQCAATDTGSPLCAETIEEIIRSVERALYWGEENKTTIPTVDDIHKAVEKALMRKKLYEIATEYISYKKNREDQRTLRSSLFETLDKVVFIDPSENDEARENANVDSNGAMAKMLHFGTSASKTYAHLKLLPKNISEAHKNGDIHIHDLDFMPTGTLTCVQIDLIDLLSRGFNTGHGFIRTPQSIRSAAALVAIVLQSGQNSQHGGIAIHSLDYGLAPYVNKTFAKELQEALATALEVFSDATADCSKASAKDIVLNNAFVYAPEGSKEDAENLSTLNKYTRSKVARWALNKAIDNTEKETFQSMEALIFNLNTLHSRAGSQTPFSSVNYGTDTSHSGRLVMRHLLQATENGLGDGETPIFPIQIFRLKRGISLNAEDPNYDLFVKACEVSAQRIYPNFLNLDAPYNVNPTSDTFVEENPEHPAAEYWKEIRDLPENVKWRDPVTGEDIRAMAASMGCRTRVLTNAHDPRRPYAAGRGNASFTTINLPRLAIETVRSIAPQLIDTTEEGLVFNTKNVQLQETLIEEFLKRLDSMMTVAEEQIKQRFDFQKKMKTKNLPFLFTQGVWIDSDKLSANDSIEESALHASLSVGYFGLAETLKALVGEHHGESDYAQEVGLRIIKHMRDRLDNKAKNEGANWSLLATPAEGIAGRFVSIDRSKYGVIEGVTDREYYTNSSHVPVYHKIDAYGKITKEAPYNALANAGHIMYVEMNGDPVKNIEAFVSIVRAAARENAGYIAINHPLDSHKKSDGGCGYHGIIDNECPECGALETEGAIFERLRRVTGYLTSDVRNMNDAKQSEISERVKHL